MAYVKIEEVLETARNGYHTDFGRSMADLTSLREVLEDTPTADVVEVKHGEWITVYDAVAIGDGTHTECSYCHAWNRNRIKTPYCPYCGATMDGESKQKNDFKE